MSRVFLCLMVFFIPFAEIGPTVQNFVITPALAFGLLYAASVLKTRWVSSSQIALIIRLGGFFLTSLGRHPFASYALSLGALGASIFPITRPLRTFSEYKALDKSLMAGLIFTLIFVTLEIFSQLAGFSSLYSSLVGLLRDPENVTKSHNLYIAYYRPYGLMSEPAHLGLYFVSTFVFLDISGNHRILRRLTFFAILLTGSISAILLLSAYFIGRAFRSILARQKSIFIIRRSHLVATFLAAMFFLFFWPMIADIIGSAGSRINGAISAFRQQELIGSEASRVNSHIALTTLWAHGGLWEILLGTGYSNYSDWLEENFRSLGSRSSFARGDVINMLIAVIVSTGIFGSILFFNFLRVLFKTHGLSVFSLLGLFVVSFQFFYGTMVFYFFWYCIFIVLSASRFRHQQG